MTKLLLVGASGLLGSEIIAQAPSGSSIEGTYNPKVDGREISTFHSLDITSKDEVERIFDKLRPDFVILAAALSSLEGCERSPELAQKVNVGGTENVAVCCKKSGARLMFISSVYVFDGEKGGRYTEEDAPRPLSVYARTKVEAEGIITSLLPDPVIVRPAVLYGWTPETQRGNFVTMIIRRLRSNEPVNVFMDQYTSPTFSGDLAQAILELSEKDFSGILNVSGPDCITRSECGSIIAEIFNLDKTLLKPVSLDGMGFVARRPMRACLDVSKAEKLLGRSMVSFREGISTMRREEQSSCRPRTFS